MKNNTIKKISLNILHNKKTPEEFYNESIEKLKKLNNPISLQIFPYAKKYDNKRSLLNGVIYSLKDNIATKDVKTTGGSKFLQNYIPKYDATVKTLLDRAGAICISKDNLDEFGLGGTGLFSAYGIVKNAFDEKRLSGGSSSGSAVMVAKGIVPFAIATDTGDSIRKPASFQGIVGFKPTYGAISRFGVFPYSPSLDHVGILANTVQDIAIVMNEIAKPDCSNDTTSIDLENDYIMNLKVSKNYKLVILNETLDNMLEPEKSLFKEYISYLIQIGFKISYENFSIQLLKLIDPVYKTISYGEATTSWANLSGLLFGEHLPGNNFEEMLFNNRTELFGRQLKRRFVIGAYVTAEKQYEKIFRQSKKVRTLIINRTNELFSKYDAILMPGASRIAPLIEDEINNNSTSNICDDALQIANFGGFPSITVPAIVYKGMYLGTNITTAIKKDQLALNIALSITRGEHE